MKFLILGDGAREHSIAKKLCESPKTDEIFICPGNAGTFYEKKCHNIEFIDENTLLNFVKKNSIDLTIVGPEKFLCEGIVDEFENNNLKIIGPNKKSSILEGSKIFSKNFMKKYKISTADYEEFNNFEDAFNFLNNINFPIVIKVDGLAAGKGVFICDNYKQSVKVLEDIMKNKCFGESGNKIIIERYLSGFEASFFVLLDEKNYKLFNYSKDHKKIGEGEKGLNTGGMGSITPHPNIDENLKIKVEDLIIKPTINGLKAENLMYKGILFFGILFENNIPYLLEYNVRFGDPETQSLLNLLDSDLVDIFNDIYNNNVENTHLKWKQGISMGLVLTAFGYPLEYKKNIEILKKSDDCDFIYYSSKISEEKAFSSGGRVLTLVDNCKNIDTLRNNLYSIAKLYNKEFYFRKDI
jgi:phosphoribosylamine--glycine ligase